MQATGKKGELGLLRHRCIKYIHLYTVATTVDEAMYPIRLK